MKNMGNTTKSNVKNKPRDLTIVKVGAAFVMMVLSMLAVQRVLEIYAVMNTFDAVYRASQICWKLCAVLCAASAAAYVLLRGKKFRGIFPYVFVLSAQEKMSSRKEKSKILVDKSASGGYNN
jgi:hypothetical protein